MGSVIKTVLMFIVVITVLMVFAANDVKRFSPPDNILPMTFAHADHAGENCLKCHHNFQDNTGGGSCINCHQTDPSVNLIIREQFHDLCMGCHNDRSSTGEPAGPLRICDDCHTLDTKP